MTDYNPQSIADILARGAAQQVPMISQPKGLAGALPGVGALAQGGLAGATAARDKKSIMDAQQAYSSYLAKVDSGTATPADHQMGYQAALSLGITPKQPNPGSQVDPSIMAGLQSKAGIQSPVKGTKENAAALERLAGLNKPPSAATGLGNEKFVQGEWDKINRATNPNNAPRGSLLGIAGQNNARADRALSNLNDPSMVIQQLDAVSTDVAGVMQGGSPHEREIAGQSFRTSMMDIAAMKQRLTGDPQAIKNPAIVAKLKQIVNDIKRVDNKIVSDNLKSAEIAFRPIIARDPKRWTEYKNSVMSTTQAATDSQSPDSTQNHDALLDKYGTP